MEGHYASLSKRIVLEFDPSAFSGRDRMMLLRELLELCGILDKFRDVLNEYEETDPLYVFVQSIGDRMIEEWKKE